MSSLDANVLLRILLNDVPAQQAAALRLVRMSGEQLYVADTAIVETVFALKRYYHRSRASIAEAIHGLMAQPTITTNQPLIRAALTHFVAHRTLSFEDCYLAAAAELADATPLWTFDKKLAKKLPAAQLVPGK